MRRTLAFHSSAQEDVAVALRWYEDAGGTAASAFLAELDIVLEAIVLDPQRFPLVRPDRRRALLRRFPFAVIFDATDEWVHVVACHHHRRNPQRWRVREEYAATA